MDSRKSTITLAKVIRIQHGKLYELMFHLFGELIHSTNTSDLFLLWHRRIAHLHHGSLSILTEFVTRILDFNIEHQLVCKGCVVGKYTKISFPRSENWVVVYFI